MHKSTNYYFTFFKVLCSMIFFILYGSIVANASNINEKSAKQLIYNVVSAQNNLDVTSYISFFTSDNQEEMQTFINEQGVENFFKENSYVIRNLTKLSNSVGEISAHMSSEELQKYDAYLYYYVESNIDFDDKKILNSVNPKSCIFDEGISYKIFVLAYEDNTWKIMRISTPNIAVIEENSEGFNTEQERIALRKQKTKMNITRSNDNRNTASLLSISYPSSITVYFTKTVNKNHYGTTSSSMSFSHYLKNVIPNEWYVSYYSSYPHYLRAGTMGCKMYGWYYSVNPKWSCAPYYADVKDSSSDQNYVYGSYSELASYYQGYVNSAISDISGIAMVNYNSALFEVHYHATSGSYHSGQMSASGALTKAQEGLTYKEILHYYFDCSSYSSNKAVKFISY